MGKYLRVVAPGSVSVPVGEANHVVVPTGAVINTEFATGGFQAQLGSPWTASLFEDASEADYNRQGHDYLEQDPNASALSVIEEITKRRSAEPVHERQGQAHEVDLVPMRRDATLPEAGDDVDANDRFAQRDGTDVEDGYPDLGVRHAEAGAGTGQSFEEANPEARADRASRLPEGTADTSLNASSARRSAPSRRKAAPRGKAADKAADDKDEKASE